jgi:hypothetical protein
MGGNGYCVGTIFGEHFDSFEGSSRGGLAWTAPGDLRGCLLSGVGGQDFAAGVAERPVLVRVALVGAVGVDLRCWDRCQDRGVGLRGQ